MEKKTNVIVRSPKNGVARIILNEPSTYTALSSSTLKLLIKNLQFLNADEKTKVIIIPNQIGNVPD